MPHSLSLGPRNRESPLWVRYNGAMLGLFLAGSHLGFCAERYDLLRERIDQFLVELGALLRFKHEREVFVEHHDRIVSEVMLAVRMESEELFRFAWLSQLAFLHVLQRGSDRASARQCARVARSMLAEIGAPAELLDSLAEHAPSGPPETWDVRGVNSALLEFVLALVTPLRRERSTAFISMPFRLSHEYTRLYAPLARRLGCRALRAWGGFGGEEYQALMLALIERSGVLIADLTHANVNVAYEVGFAHGRGAKRVYLLAREDSRLPSNFTDLAAYAYPKCSLRRRPTEQLDDIALNLDLWRSLAAVGRKTDAPSTRRKR